MQKNPTFPAEGLKFLRSLKRNNRREWFQPRREEYEELVRRPMAEFVMAIGRDLRRAAPEIVADPAVSLYRIYRDTRFSADKKPYKTHAAAIFPWRGLGKKAGACLYFHIATGEVVVAGGTYAPTPDELLAERQHIADHLAAFRRIVRATAFRRRFGELQGETLTRVPRAFPAVHPAAEYLKFKQFLAIREYAPDFAVSPGFYAALLADFRDAIPLVRFLNQPLVAAARKPKPSGFQHDFRRIID